MDLETEVKPRFLNHEAPRTWFLTDLENGTVIQLSQTAKPKDYIYSVACVVQHFRDLLGGLLAGLGYFSCHFLNNNYFDVALQN